MGTTIIAITIGGNSASDGDSAVSTEEYNTTFASTVVDATRRLNPSIGIETETRIDSDIGVVRNTLKHNGLIASTKADVIVVRVHTIAVISGFSGGESYGGAADSGNTKCFPITDIVHIGVGAAKVD